MEICPDSPDLDLSKCDLDDDVEELSAVASPFSYKPPIPLVVSIDPGLFNLGVFIKEQNSDKVVACLDVPFISEDDAKPGEANKLISKNKKNGTMLQTMYKSANLLFMMLAGDIPNFLESLPTSYLVVEDNDNKYTRMVAPALLMSWQRFGGNPFNCFVVYPVMVWNSMKKKLKEEGVIPKDKNKIIGGVKKNYTVRFFKKTYPGIELPTNKNSGKISDHVADAFANAFFACHIKKFFK